MIRWFANNPVAANLLMASIVIMGVLSLYNNMVIEFFPSVSVDTVTVRVPYRGATPKEIEELVVIRVEEAVEEVEGIKSIRSVSAENIGTVNLEVESGYDPRDILDDVKNRVDAINTFPDDIERPVLTLSQRLREAISVIVSGDFNEDQLRRVTEQVREDLLELPAVTRADVGAVKKPELAIEIDEYRLREYNLTLDEVSRKINQYSQDLPAGAIDTRGGEILIRTLGQAYKAEDFAEIILIHENEALVKLSDIATIKDEYEEDSLYALFNGRRCGIVEVFRVGDQSAIEITDQVKAYVEETDLGEGIELSYWRDRGKVIRSRLDTLLRSAWQGGILVFILLTLFLRPTLALWVCLGIPVSFMGALIFMPTLGVSINIISLFGFILVLGIVVDDAIVTGENIFRHIRKGELPLDAAIKGTQEVSVPVTFGVLTTAVAFIPLLMLEGRRGDIFAQLTIVIIPVLLFSLIESKLILPSHLRHLKPLNQIKANRWTNLQIRFVEGMEQFVNQIYQPILHWCLKSKFLALTIFFCSCALIFAYWMSGRVGFTPFPRVASETPSVSLQMPLGTTFETTQKHIEHITQQAYELKEKYTDPETGQSAIRNILSIFGANGVGRSPQSHLGRVRFDTVPPEIRDVDVKTPVLANEWRKKIGEIPGAESISIRSEIGRASDPIDIQLSHEDFKVLKEASERIKSYLGELEGVFDISDTFASGKQEIQIELKPESAQLGVTTQLIARQIRNSFFGSEAQRLQRNKDDLRVMVRFPIDHRQNSMKLYRFKVQLPNGHEVPLEDCAHIIMGQSYSTINRIDGKRTLSIRADIEKGKVDQSMVMSAIALEVPKIINKVDSRIGVELEGEEKEKREMSGSLVVGLMVLLLILYALLAIPFKSYLQPFIVMSVIPFGLVGAVLGHIFMGVSFSFPSIFGILALIGIVVNDSLVMVDYINKHRVGDSLEDAVRKAGMVRFRPIILTSLTTFFGLIPLLMEQSTQAQFLKPMAISLGFGILFATVITLFVVPLFYLIYAKYIVPLLRLSLLSFLTTERD